MEDDGCGCLGCGCFLVLLAVAFLVVCVGLRIYHGG